MANAMRSLTLVVGASLFLSIAGAAQVRLNYNPDARKDAPLPLSKAGDIGAKAAYPFDWPIKPFDAKVNWKEEWVCELGTPAEVQGFNVVCTGASYLDFVIADCCIDGDHWQLKGKAWDVNPNTAVTTSPGPDSIYGAPGRVYNYGGVPVWSPGRLDAYVECTYLNGVNSFAAGSYVLFTSDGTCSVKPDTVRQRIDRTP